jgi:hypothetical protein
MNLLDDLCADLQAERDEPADVLAGLDETCWETMTELAWSGLRI